MVGQVTLTAKTGAGVQVTAQVITGVSGLVFNLVNGTLGISRNEAEPGSFEQFYDLTGVTVVTCVIAGTTYTWVVS